jgi:dTDP-4-dehydrorhamnose reductase
MRVLITGAGGQVGTDLTSVLTGIVPPAGATTGLLGASPVGPDEFEVASLDRSRLDIVDADAVASAVDAFAPEVIVHLAAYTAVDRAEGDVMGATAVNEAGTRNVVRAASRSGAHVVYVSTDYVFAGELGRALVESDATGPLSVYGATKLAGERACRPTDTIVRTSWVAGLSGRNVIHLAAAAGREGRALRFVDDQIGTLTSSADLAAGLVAMVRQRPGGVFHVAGDGAASWHEVISHAVVAAGGSADQVTPISTAELDPQPAATRPSFSPLVSERLAEIEGVPLPRWQDGVARLVAAITSKGES